MSGRGGEKGWGEGERPFVVRVPRWKETEMGGKGKERGWSGREDTINNPPPSYFFHDLLANLPCSWIRTPMHMEKGFPAEILKVWRSLGARIIGGCCHVNPVNIREIKNALATQ